MKVLKREKNIMAVAEEIAKRDGVFISRKLLLHSAKKWHAWGERHDIPNLLAPEDMHVTLLHSKVDVKVPLLETTMNIRTVGDGYCGGACFAMFGPAEDHLVMTFSNWELHDRHWAFLSAGGVSEWPSYRPHLTIASDLVDFELSDDALADVPAWIVLGPEENADIKVKTGVAKSESLLTVTDAMKVAAQALVDAPADGMSLIDAYDLKDVTKGRFPIEVQKRLSDAAWTPAELKAPAAAAETRKRSQKEITISVSSLPEEIRKGYAGRDIFKANEDEQIVMGIASVSTEKGELIIDSHGDKVTTKALVEFNRSLISGGREGKIMHQGEACTEVVAGLVLTEEWQKSLGIDLGYEPYLVEIHVPDPGQWSEIKKGDGWMLSIAGLMWYYEDEADADV